MLEKNISRRELLRVMGVGVAGVTIAACAPKVVEEEEAVVEEEEEAVVEEEEEEVVEEEEEVVEQEAAPVETVTLRNVVWGAAAPQIPMYETFAGEFHGKNPGIEIEYLFLPEDQYMPRLKTMEAAGDPPEVCMPIGGHVRYFRAPDHNSWLDFRPLVERDGYDLSDFAEPSMFSVTDPFSGSMDGLPVQLFAGFIVYNKDLFAEAGVPAPPREWDTDEWDHEALLNLAKQLTLDENGNHPDDPGFDPDNIVQYGLHDSGDETLWGWIFGGAGPQSDPEDRTTVRVGEPEYIEGWQFWWDLNYTHHVCPPPVEAEEFVGMYSSPFHTGRVAMSRGMTWNVNSYKEIEEFEWDFAPQIHGPARDRFRDRLCMDQGSMFREGKHHDEGWEWIKYCASPEMTVRFSVDLRECLPPRVSKIPEYGKALAKDVPDVRGDLVAESLPFAHYVEYWTPPTEWGEIWNPYVDMVRMGEAKPGEVFPEAQEELQANWDEYYAQFDM